MDRMNHNSNRRIMLFGQQNLQNSILIGYIHQRTNIDGMLVNPPHWQDDWSHFDGQQLALIDAEFASLEQIKLLLEAIDELPGNTSVAFLNVPHGHEVEHLVNWPCVTGLFYNDGSQQQLGKGIQSIFRGELWLPRQLLTAYLQRTRQRPVSRSTENETTVLTKREKQILRLTATGATNVEIAENLNVSTHTVKTHIYNLFKKIGAGNRIQAVNWAKQNLEGVLQD